jgi:type IV pilus assembly protein PilX
MSLTTWRRNGRRFAVLQRRNEQRGLVLLVVLVVLVLMFLAGLGVMRAADTANVISGNFSFQQAAVQASDRAITDALTVIANRVAGGAGNTDVSNQYLATRATALDARGIPTSIDWDDVSCVTEKGAVIADCAADTGNFRVQYMVERMCLSNPSFADINDIRAKCEYEASATGLSASSIGLRYRVLIRVRGPRGTESWFEAMLSGPAST